MDIRSPHSSEAPSPELVVTQLMAFWRLGRYSVEDLIEVADLLNEQIYLIENPEEL